MAAALKDPNEYINLYDPPKDMTGESYSAAARPKIKKLIQELFQKTAPDSVPNTAAGDTKKKMKKLFETGEAGQTGLLAAIISDKTRQLQILREVSTSGHDARPVGLFIAQDSGSKDVVKNPTYIITPGTILDPAGKTKEGAVDWLTEGDYATLPFSYIEMLKMDKAISGDIKMKTTATEYEFTIPVTFGPAAAGGGKEIKGKLKKSTFLPEDPTGADTDEDFFRGNATKNTYIKGHYESNPERCKKFILVKELGDSLQVIWLRRVFDLAAQAAAQAQAQAQAQAAAAAAAAAATPKYTKENTAIITGDTVLWYRALHNEVGVILTYEGNTTYYSANPEAADAAFIIRIREETIAHNISVINALEKVITFPFTPGQGKSTALWINASTWTREGYTKAVNYLNKLKTELIKQNNDFDVYFKGFTTRESAKEFAANVHFINPFTWSRSNGSWIVNNKLTYLRTDKKITFSGANFKASVIQGPTNPLVENRGIFAGIGATRGGGQKGGARMTKAAKETLVAAKRAEVGGNEKLAIPLLIAHTDSEWFMPGGSDVPDVLPSALARGNSEFSTVKAAPYVGTANNFVARSEYEKYWLANVDPLLGHGVHPIASLRDKSPNFLYMFVRDFCPEIFTLAYMVKSIGIAGFDNVTLDLPTKYKLFYYMTPADKMIVYKEAEGGGDDDDYKKSNDLKDETYNATMNAIALAKLMATSYPHLVTNFTADFLALVSLYVPLVPNTAGLALQPRQLGAMTLASLDGGGKPKQKQIDIAQAAINNYEIYYSLAIKAAYEDRKVTEHEFQEALGEATPKQSVGITAENLEQFFSTYKGPYTGQNVGQLNEPWLQIGKPYGKVGGKTKYKKTRKQKKRRSIRKRKTRKQK